MIIQVDKEAKTAVTQLCDIALKQGGLQVMQGVAKVLNSVELLPEPKREPEKKEGDSGETGGAKPQ